ncbi:hypothetical protein WK17_21210 [Burkholderia multivorans]|nr:hypothetical protein WK17_21210 [Burkholderia multivorans]
MIAAARLAAKRVIARRGCEVLAIARVSLFMCASLRCDVRGTDVLHFWVALSMDAALLAAKRVIVLAGCDVWLVTGWCPSFSGI